MEGWTGTAPGAMDGLPALSKSCPLFTFSIAFSSWQAARAKGANNGEKANAIDQGEEWAHCKVDQGLLGLAHFRRDTPRGLYGQDMMKCLGQQRAKSTGTEGYRHAS